MFSVLGESYSFRGIKRAEGSKRCFADVCAMEKRGAFNLFNLSFGSRICFFRVFPFPHHHQHSASGSENLLSAALGVPMW